MRAYANPLDHLADIAVDDDVQESVFLVLRLFLHRIVVLLHLRAKPLIYNVVPVVHATTEQVVPLQELDLAVLLQSVLLDEVLTTLTALHYFEDPHRRVLLCLRGNVGAVLGLWVHRKLDS